MKQHGLFQDQPDSSATGEAPVINISQAVKKNETESGQLKAAPQLVYLEQNTRMRSAKQNLKM